MKTLKAVFTVNDIVYREHNGIKASVEVSLNACYANDVKDINHAFWLATPTGSLKMQINNPNAFDFFTQGKNVTLTLAVDE